MYALLDKMGLIAFVTKMAVIPVTVIADAMAITAVIAYNGCNSLYDFDGSNGHNGSYGHTEYDGLSIFDFCYIAYISNKCC